MRTVLFFGSLLCACAGASAAENFATTKLVKGHAFLQLPGESKAIAMTMNTALPKESIIKTEAQSFVQFVMTADNSIVNIGPNAQMKLTASGGINMLDLKQGQMRARVTKEQGLTEDKLLIKAGSTAMGIRGTDFAVSFDPRSNRTSLFTFEGKVAMAALVGAASPQAALKQSAILVAAGSSSQFRPGLASPIPPAPIPAQQLQNFLSRPDAVPSTPAPAPAKAGDQAANENDARSPGTPRENAAPQTRPNADTAPQRTAEVQGATSPRDTAPPGAREGDGNGPNPPMVSGPGSNTPAPNTPGANAPALNPPASAAPGNPTIGGAPQSAGPGTTAPNGPGAAAAPHEVPHTAGAGLQGAPGAALFNAVKNAVQNSGFGTTFSAGSLGGPKPANPSSMSPAAAPSQNTVGAAPSTSGPSAAMPVPGVNPGAATAPMPAGPTNLGGGTAAIPGGVPGANPAGAGVHNDGPNSGNHRPPPPPHRTH